jgi:hypothetical protein
MEYFLTEIFLSTRNNTTPRPQLFDGAWLQTRYDSEFGLVEIPLFVRKVIFPVIVFIGKLTGRDRKFKGSPEPIRS